jgi:hypothetical protein
MIIIPMAFSFSYSRTPTFHADTPHSFSPGKSRGTTIAAGAFFNEDVSEPAPQIGAKRLRGVVENEGWSEGNGRERTV